MKYPSRLPALQSSLTGLFQHDRSQTQPGAPALPVLCVVGTRPEAIKMAPVIRTLSTSGWATPVTVATGQQQSLLDDALADFDIRVNVRLPHTGASHSPASFLAHCLTELDEQISLRQPAAVIAQGDTTSVHAAAMAAFYRRIPFVHVEAGLRTGDMDAPFPEEYHRRAVALATLLHCAPTQAAAANLRGEGIAEARILVSGNTVIDALLATAARRPPLPLGFPPTSAQQRVILLTLHRRENFGPNIHNALTAVRAFVDAHADVSVWFPVHPNPNARDVVHSLLSGHPRIHLVEPMPYRDLVAVMGACWCVLTDSGGLQEEAPALGKPVLVLRESTERPEAVEAGVAELVGTDQARVTQALNALYQDPQKYRRMARVAMPFGDGRAASRIVDALGSQLERARQGAAHAPLDHTSHNAHQDTAPARSAAR